MPKALIGDVSLNYRQVGAGEDMVLVHGLAANLGFWNLNLLLPLARHFRVTTYDLRGHGYSDMPSTGYTSRDMAADLVGLMDDLGIERAHLVGHSFGGVVALHCAVSHPDRVSSLTLQDSRLRALQPTQRLIDWPDWKQAKAKLASMGIDIDENEDEVGVKLLQRLAEPQWRQKSQRHENKPLFIPFSGWAAGNRSAAKWLRLLDTTSTKADIQETAGLTRERIAGVRQPTLALYGEHSRCLRTFHALPEVLHHCRSRIIPEVGHFYPLIKPRVVADLVLEFVGDVCGIDYASSDERRETLHRPAMEIPDGTEVRSNPKPSDASHGVNRAHVRAREISSTG
jgi:pimeloyl-ACP methyl ester carboxylesterase